MGITNENTINLESNTIATPSECFIEDTGLNEGCEYEKEILLPRIYKSPFFVIPAYDDSKADISMVNKYVRTSHV